MPGGNNHRPLKHLTADDLWPLWSRLDIPTERVAQALGVTRAGLSYKARSLGLPPRTGNKECCKKCPDEVFRRMYEAGVGLQDIADKFGYTRRQSVTQRRVMMGLKPRGRLGGGHAGWGCISLAQFQEMELARMMTEMAARAGKVGDP